MLFGAGKLTSQLCFEPGGKNEAQGGLSCRCLTGVSVTMTEKLFIQNDLNNNSLYAHSPHIEPSTVNIKPIVNFYHQTGLIQLEGINSHPISEASEWLQNR
jgi:hypothetical protein